MKLWHRLLIFIGWKKRKVFTGKKARFFVNGVEIPFYSGRTGLIDVMGKYESNQYIVDEKETK